MDLTKLSAEDLKAIAAGDMTKVSAEGLANLTSETPPVRQGSGVPIIDATNAVSTGAGRGAARLLGMPVDTAASAIDLPKALVGSIYQAASGKPAPSWLEPMDRTKVPLTGDWLLKQINKTAPTAAMVNPSNPSYEGGYLQNAGSAMTGVFNPAGWRDAAGQIAKNVVAGAMGKATGDATGNTSLAIAASMTPYAKSGSGAPAPTRKSQVTQAGQAEGYVVPPSQAGAGWVTQRLESIAGKAALNQDSIGRNQGVSNRLGARSVGLDVDNLNPEALRDLRAEAGRRGYAPIDRIGTIPSTLTYQGELADMAQNTGNSLSGVEALRVPQVIEMARDLNQPSFTGPEVNGLIKKLREQGNARAYNSYGTDPDVRTLGRAMLDGSGALENLVNEHLTSAGPSNIVPGLIAARREIAQNHTIDSALSGNGNVNARSLAAAQERGIPLSGDQQLIADFSTMYPKLTIPGADVPTPGVSALEAVGVPLMAAAGHTASGSPAGLIAGGLPLMRTPIRNMLLSRWYQDRYAHRPDVSTGIDPESAGALTKMLFSTGEAE